MHGILFKRLKTYVEAEYGDDAWADAMEAAGIEPKLYLPVTEYPQAELVRLVDGVVDVTGVDENRLLEALGADMAPALLDTFEAHLKEDWDAMDLLADADNEVYAVLRSDDDSVDVATERRDEDTVLVEYSADLEMCRLAEGMFRAIGEEYGEHVDVSERVCMHRGGDACEFEVQRA